MCKFLWPQGPRSLRQALALREVNRCAGVPHYVRRAVNNESPAGPHALRLWGVKSVAEDLFFTAYERSE